MSQDITVTLARDIQREYELAEKAWRSAVEHAIECGRLLSEAKGHVRHGEWGAWLDEHFPASRRTAQGYMRLAARAEDAQALAHLGIEGALRQLAAPKGSPENRDRAALVDRARGIVAEAQEEAEALLEAARDHLRHEIAATDAKDHLVKAKLYIELAETYGGPALWEDEAAIRRALEPLSSRELFELEGLATHRPTTELPLASC